MLGLLRFSPLTRPLQFPDEPLEQNYACSFWSSFPCLPPVIYTNFRSPFLSMLHKKFSFDRPSVFGEEDKNYCNSNIFSFWSFEISKGIWRHQQNTIGLDSFSYKLFIYIYIYMYIWPYLDYTSLCIDYPVERCKMTILSLSPCCQIYRVTEEAVVVAHTCTISHQYVGSQFYFYRILGSYTCTYIGPGQGWTTPGGQKIS